MNPNDSIFNYITSQESMFKLPIRLNDTWQWNFPKHIQTSENYSFSQLINSEKGDYTPVKNITRPILNLQHRTEDIELKDVQIYVDDADKYHLSFLVKKYHDDVFVRKNNLDTFFDDLNVSRIDFGGGLSKKTNEGREVVPLQSIVFCDQTDMLSGPIGIKHFYSPDQLLDMADRGWGNKANGATHSLDEVITLSREEKKEDKDKTVTKTPGRYIEVYEVHGNLPKRYANQKDETGKYETRIFIVCFYTPKDGVEKKGIILYTELEKETPFKLIKRDPIYGRALGFGGAEELFEAQVWTNYDMIRKQNMLDAAAVTVLSSDDPTISAKHPSGLKNIKNLEIIDRAPNTTLSQVDTFPRNLKIFENDMVDWQNHAKEIGASQDPLTGAPPTAGTPFASLQAQIQQGMGLHESRRGIFARHIEEIYNDDFIPMIQREITKGTKFLSELSLDEMQYVSDCLVRNQTNKFIINKVLNGEEITSEQVDVYKELVKEEFKRKGNKHFIEILKGEFKDALLSVKVTVAGKSKNLGQHVDKLSSMVRFVISTFNPQTGGFTALDDPRIAKMVNDIWESSGFSPVDFSSPPKKETPQPSPYQSPSLQLPNKQPIIQ